MRIVCAKHGDSGVHDRSPECAEYRQRLERYRLQCEARGWIARGHDSPARIDALAAELAGKPACRGRAGLLRLKVEMIRQLTERRHGKAS